MQLFRIPATVVPFLGFLLVVQVGFLSAQQRPGVRMFVNTPEGCQVAEPVAPENISEFLEAQIQALSLAERGEQANKRVLASKGVGPIEDKTITGLRAEKIDNTCASFIISYYKESQNQTIARVAKLLVGAYDGFGDMSNEMLGISLQKSLQRFSGPSPQRQFARLMNRREETLRKMTEALNLSLSLFVDDGRLNAEGKPDHLRITKQEVKDLLAFLYSRFPVLQDKKEGANSGEFTKQAELIQKFLTGGYTSADLP
jgi:hypothetical protein